MDINYCVRCGTALETRLAFGKQRPVCPACGYVHFSDPKVAAVVFVRRQDRVLLIKRANNPEKGKWALPAGYVDGGEDPRQAAIRETYEETGLEIEIVDLLDVIHNRDGGASIAIVFKGQVKGGKLCANDDATAADWFTADNLPDIAFASTRNAIHRWMKE